MKRFKFPLESLRVLRQQKEHAAQLRYARALNVCSHAEQQVKNAAAELDKNWNFLRGELASAIGADKLAQLRTWCTVLEIRWHERKAALLEARRVAEIAFREVLAATRDREGLDRFHDRARLAHDQESLRAEQKNFDEMAVQSSSARVLLQFAGPESAY
jgi:flagellar export protein FliJ